MHGRPLKQQRPGAGPGRLQGRAAAGDAEADDYHVVPFGALSQHRRRERGRYFRTGRVHVTRSGLHAVRETVEVALHHLPRSVRQSPEEFGGAGSDSVGSATAVESLIRDVTTAAVASETHGSRVRL